MWAHEIDSPPYAARLTAIAEGLPALVAEEDR
jgi:hypothetical protein